MQIVRIENVNHRLGNGSSYYYHPALKHMGTEHPVLFTAAEMLAATLRAQRAKENPLCKGMFPVPVEPVKIKVPFAKRLRVAWLILKEAYQMKVPAQ